MGEAEAHSRGRLCHPGRDRIKSMSADDILSRAQPPADARIAYGSDPHQFGELRLPKSKGSHPVVMNIHGGFWRAKYDLLHASHLCAALTRAGAATWNLEYRRVGNPGGAWPGTFEDITNGYRFLRQIARQYHLDLTRVVVMGHSAGGHLAVALAGHQAPRQAPEQAAASNQASKQAANQASKQAPKQAPEPTARQSLEQAQSAAMQSSKASAGTAADTAGDAEPRICGVVSLAGVLDLQRAWELHLSNDAVVDFLGGTPAQMPDHYREADPMQLKVTAEQHLIHGSDDDIVPVEISRKYLAAKQAKGEKVTLTELTKTGHFEVIDPESAVWGVVERTVMGLLSR